MKVKIPSMRWTLGSSQHFKLREGKGEGEASKQSGKSSLSCCTKLLFLEIVILICMVLHVLALSLSFSMFNHLARQSINFSGEDFDTKSSATDLAAVSIIGLICNIFALIGLSKKQRHFLLPLIVFLFVFIVIDIVTVVIFAVSSKETKSVPEPAADDDGSGVEVRLLGPEEELGQVQQHHKTSILLYPLLGCKIFFSIIILKVLMDVFRRDLSMRSNRSPLRNVTNKKATEKTVASPEIKTSPVNSFKYSQFP